MYCPKCRAEVADGVNFCSQCGAALQEEETLAKSRLSPKAIRSLAYGALAIIPVIGLISGPAAIVVGIAALRAISRSQGRLTGQGLAIVAIIMGSVFLSCNVCFMRERVVTFMEAVARSKMSEVRADMKIAAAALEAYYADHKCYPAWGVGEEGANSFAGPEAGVYRVPTFRICKDSNEYGTFHTLTTPTAYLPAYYRDPFSDTEGATFCYYSDGQGWIMWSWGPDRDESERQQWDLAADVQKVYSSEDRQPTLILLTGTSTAPAHEAYTYDPTNGIFSPGDIWRVKE